MCKLIGILKAGIGILISRAGLDGSDSGNRFEAVTHAKAGFYLIKPSLRLSFRLQPICLRSGLFRAFKIVLQFSGMRNQKPAMLF